VAAYAAALARRGLDHTPSLIAQCDQFDQPTWQRAVDQLLAAGVTAIISMGPMAVIAGVLQRLRDVGRRIPEDISIITYDENELALAKPPQLTVISRPVDELARLASRLVMARLANPGGPPRVEVVRMHLVVRESTGPVAAPMSAVSR
jgi:LacI family transcriptional regulator